MDARESGDDELFRDTSQEAWKYFPDKIQFLYLLVIAQRQCGNTGKAVKNAEAFYYMPQDEMYDAYTKKFAMTDVKLCMIMEKEDILKQAEILKQEYAFLYEKIEPFLRQLSDEKKIGLLKERLLKDYQRMYPEFEQGYFAEKYPQEMKRVFGISFYEGDMPYVRTEKKIGRNDPCPCGSGKKYKQCCGRK